MLERCRRRFATHVVTLSAVVTGLLAAVSLAGGAGTPVEPGQSVEAYADHLEATMTTSMRRFAVPGAAVALVRGGEVVWTGAYGFADLERTEPMTPEAVFHTGSISKSVTAWGVLRLVEQGAVDLDQPVTRYVPGLEIEGSSYPHDEITVRRALSHTTGAWLGPIGNEYPVDGAVPSPREALARDLRIVTPPGTTFRYSNPGFDLLELVVEGATGRPFADAMRDGVLVPLGMEDASFAWRDSVAARVPMGYDLHGEPVRPFVYATKASGGLFATVDDVARFVAASVGPGGGAVLSDAGRNDLHAFEVEIPGAFGVVADGYGLGHFVEDVVGDRRAVWHGGQGHGWMTHFHAVPELGAGIVILTNSQRSWPLISVVLRDWARWSGIGAVKMARIGHGVTAMRMLVGAMLGASAWLVVGLVGSVRAGRRRFAPLARAARPARALQALVGAAAIAVLAWSAVQPYLLVTSVFPGAIEAAAWSTLLLASILLASAAFAPTRATRA